jgi:hypothetical protein
MGISISEDVTDFTLKMGCKYDTVRICTIVHSRISEDWSICEAVIFMVVPFVYCNFHASTYTNRLSLSLTHTHTQKHTHTHMRVMSSDGMLYKINSFFSMEEKL